MMRPFTAICMLAAAGSGFYLFQAKNAAMLLDRDIAKIMRQVDQARERTGLLRAEYARLTGPGPIGELATQLLPELKATQPGQYAALNDLERRLPPIGAPQPAQPLEPQAPDAVPPRAEPAHAEPPRPELAKPPAIAAAPALVPAQSPVLPVTLVPTVSLAQSVTQPAAKPPAPRPAPAPQVAAVQPTPAPSVQATPVAMRTVPHTAPSALASASMAPSAIARVEPAVLRPPPSTPAEAIARITRGEPVNPSVPAVASALGMARTLSPTPISSVQAATFQPGSLR